MSTLKPYTYEELSVGTQGTFTKTLTERDIALFGETSGDVNPVHFDEEYASGTPFEGRIAHGMWSAGLISTCIGIIMPGPGSIYRGQELKFVAPVRIGDTLTVTCTVKEKVERKKFVVLDCQVHNQNGDLVTVGDAKVMPPTDNKELSTPNLPKISVEGID